LLIRPLAGYKVKKKMLAVQPELLRKITELALNEAAERNW